MNTNELTYNAIAAGDIIPNDWCSIDISNCTDTLFNYTLFIPASTDPLWDKLKYTNQLNNEITIDLFFTRLPYTVTFDGQPNSLILVNNLGEEFETRADGEPEVTYTEPVAFVGPSYTTYNSTKSVPVECTIDKEICFKLSVWNLQCKFSKKVLEYINKLSYGIVSDCLLEDLIEFKYGLEVLNRYNPKLFGTEPGQELNSISYETIVNILNKLSLKYK
jgi:hypothetical protein